MSHKGLAVALLALIVVLVLPQPEDLPVAGQRILAMLKASPAAISSSVAARLMQSKP